MPVSKEFSAARHNRANSGKDRSPSIHTSIAPNTAAAMQRAATVTRSRASVPARGG